MATKAPSMTTSARAFAEAKHRHIATIHNHVWTNPSSNDQSNTRFPQEKIRSHADLSARKVMHDYIREDYARPTVSSQNKNTSAPDLTLRDYQKEGSFSGRPASPRPGSPRIVLATGDLLETPSVQGEVFTSHRAFSAAKSRHYTPHLARGVQQQQQQESQIRTASAVPEQIIDSVRVKRVESGVEQTNVRAASRTSSGARAPQGGENPSGGTPRAYSRTSTPDARIPAGHQRDVTYHYQPKAAYQPTYGTTGHHLSSGVQSFPTLRAAGTSTANREMSAARSGRRVYAMPRMHTGSIY